MAKEFKCDGETFLLDDSKGCFVEVTYDEHQEYVGVVGVSTNGTESTPYAVSIISTPNGSDRDKVIKGNQVVGNGAGDLDTAIAQCCAALIKTRRRYEGRKQFDPEAACRKLHEEFENLPES